MTVGLVFLIIFGHGIIVFVLSVLIVPFVSRRRRLLMLSKTRLFVSFGRIVTVVRILIGRMVTLVVLILVGRVFMFTMTSFVLSVAW